MKEIDLMRLYNRVLITFGIVNQTFMLVEECAELLNAVAKMKRGRAGKEDIIKDLQTCQLWSSKWHSSMVGKIIKKKKKGS